MQKANTHGQFLALPLARRHIDQAFPLVQLVAPSTDLRRWRTYARWYLMRPREQGIIAVWGGGRHICGLANFRIQMQLDEDPILISDKLIYVDLVDPAPIKAVLIASLNRVAADFGCCRIGSAHDRVVDVFQDLEQFLPPAHTDATQRSH